MKRNAVLGLVLLVSSGCASQSASLGAALKRSAPNEPGSTVAVSVVDLSSGVRSSLHGDVRLPMMSVFKLPLAVVALDAVDRGQMSLKQRIPIVENDLRPDTPLAEAWKAGEHAPTLDFVLKKMIQESDNTAGDRMVSVFGGGTSVTVRLRALGISGIDIAEPEINIDGRWLCQGTPVPAGGWTAAVVDACPEPSFAQKFAAAQREIAHAPNAASTDAIAYLLSRLDSGILLSERSRLWLLDVMAGTVNGPKRIKGLLPPGTPVAHKPGTGGLLPALFVATNDVGIVTMPSGRRFAICVFITGSRRPVEEQEIEIARVVRAVWDTMAQ